MTGQSLPPFFRPRNLYEIKERSTPNADVKLAARGTFTEQPVTQERAHAHQSDRNQQRRAESSNNSCSQDPNGFFVRPSQSEEAASTGSRLHSVPLRRTQHQQPMSQHPRSHREPCHAPPAQYRQPPQYFHQYKRRHSAPSLKRRSTPEPKEAPLQFSARSSSSSAMRAGDPSEGTHSPTLEELCAEDELPPLSLSERQHMEAIERRFRALPVMTTQTASGEGGLLVPSGRLQRQFDQARAGKKHLLATARVAKGAVEETPRPARVSRRSTPELPELQVEASTLHEAVLSVSTTVNSPADVSFRANTWSITTSPAPRRG
ncbi:hypothetical protein CYMTET_17853, partial [Cymbomonas tetramitiformis]